MSEKIERPPLDGSLRSSVHVILELLWLSLSSVPVFLTTLRRKIFPGDGKDLTGKIILVTGAGNGLGRELSFQLSRLKCRLICVDIKEADNDETVRRIVQETGNESSAKGYVCDVSNIDDIEKLKDKVLKDFGYVDILINNAGIIYSNTILSGEVDNIKRVVDVNLMSSYWMTRSFLPHMKARKEGHLVYMNSMASLTPVGGGSIYSITKLGLLGLAWTLDDQFRRDSSYSNIKITSVHPYFIGTDNWYSQSLFNTRIKPMTTEDAAKHTIIGIRREYLNFQIPGLDTGFWLSWILRCLPVKVYHMLRDVMYADLKVLPSDEEFKNIPKKSF